MKAMVLDQIAPIEAAPLQLLEMPDPVPGAGEVRLKVHCCALCRTDLHVIEGDLPPQHLPITPGHQIVGVVDQLGLDCQRLKIGDRVGVAWLRYTCGRCRFCTTGRENLCEAALFTGYHAHGGYAEYAIVHEDFAYTIPDAFSDIDAAPLLCAGIIGYRALQRSNLPTSGKLAIFGFGSSAHVVLQLALHRDCEVYVVTRQESHQQMARDLGAVWAGADAAQMPAKVDSAILFAPVGQLVPPALASLEKGGTLALAGIYMTPTPTLDYEQHLYFERDIRSVTANTRQDGRELLAECARIPVHAHTTLYPLQEANRALQDLKQGRINGTGVLVVNC